jgi:two-component system NarL family sensor kinase
MERQRIARHLHGGVGQLLAAIQIQLELAGAHLSGAAPAVGQAFDRVRALASDALEQTRSIAHSLYAPAWQTMPLDAALKQLCDLSGIGQRFAGGVRIEAPRHEPDSDVKTLFYRVAQEALSNIFRHSRATRVDIVLETLGDRLALTVQDNGVGFDTQSVLGGRPSVAAGIGLRALREQAAALGASFVMKSGPTGTKLEVGVPLFAVL